MTSVEDGPDIAKYCRLAQRVTDDWGEPEWMEYEQSGTCNPKHASFETKYRVRKA